MPDTKTLGVNDVPILLKGWEIVQAIAKSNGESAWNMRAWGISVWCALMAYAYTSRHSELFTIALLLVVVVFLIELAIRQVQYKFIDKSVEIERCITAILVGDDPDLPPNGISTNISIPSMMDLRNLLSIKRWLIWLPYCLLAFATIGAIILGIGS